ncbi:hypothetical protein MJH12_14515, partial [bacterium]|nr:hypothetical protein [bacterium]
VSQVYTFLENRWLLCQKDINLQIVSKQFSHLLTNASYFIKSDYAYFEHNQSNFAAPRKDHSVAINDSKIYVTGGQYQGNTLSSVERYSFDSRTWQLFPNLLEARYDHSTIVHNDTLYVYGGISTQDLSSLEVFDINTSSVWQNISNTTGTRSGHSSEVTSTHMYIIGGFTSINNTGSLTNQMLSYQFSTQQWKVESTGGSSRIHHDSVLANHKIYIIGGTAKDFDIYDINTKTWSKEQDLLNFRMHHQLYYFDQYIYVIGGEDEQANFYQAIWRYSLSDGSWDYDYKNFSTLSKFDAQVYENKLFLLGGESDSRIGNANYKILSLDSSQTSTNNRSPIISNLQSNFNRGLVTLNFNSADLDSDLFYHSSLSYQINTSNSDGFIITTHVLDPLDLIEYGNHQTIRWSSNLDLFRDYDSVFLKLESWDDQG